MSIVDADGVIIDLGRRSRVFTGSTREAASPAGRPRPSTDDVSGPAAGTATARSTTPNHGRRRPQTNLRNAGPLCARHNRFKTRGYRTWRDPHGIWHTQRPDGTEIQAA